MSRKKQTCRAKTVRQGDEMKQVLSDAKQEIIFKQLHSFSAAESHFDIILKQLYVSEVHETIV